MSLELHHEERSNKQRDYFERLSDNCDKNLMYHNQFLQGHKTRKPLKVYPYSNGPSMKRDNIESMEQNSLSMQEMQEKNSANMYEKELNDYNNFLKMNNLNTYASADLELQKNTPLNNNNFNSLPPENDRYNNPNIMPKSNNQPQPVENYNKTIVESNYNPHSTRAQDNNFIDYRNEVNKNQRQVNSNNSVLREFKNDNQNLYNGGLTTTDVTNNELVYKANSGIEYDQYQNVLYLFD